MRAQDAEEGHRPGRPRLTDRVLDWIERVGNKLPDPAVLFVLAMLLTSVVSAAFRGYEFEVPKKSADPSAVRTESQTFAVEIQLSGENLAAFLADMVKTFLGFKPLGVVLVALLGVGVAEKAGFIAAVIKQLLALTPRRFLTAMLMVVGILSHTAVDAGYVLVIPLGGVLFYAAGRHPLAGIAAAFAGVSGGFSANFVPVPLDPQLQSMTQEAAEILDAARQVNPLCNYYFTTLSSGLVIAFGWFITDRIVEPRLRATAVDGDPAEMPKMEPPSAAHRRGLVAGLAAVALSAVVLVAVCVPESSPPRSSDPRAPGELVVESALLMKALVPLIFLFTKTYGAGSSLIIAGARGRQDLPAHLEVPPLFRQVEPGSRRLPASSAGLPLRSKGVSSSDARALDRVCARVVAPMAAPGARRSR